MQLGTAGWPFKLGDMVYYELPDHVNPLERGKRRTGMVNLLAVKEPGLTQIHWVNAADAGDVGAAHVRIYNDDHLPAIHGDAIPYIVLPLDELVPLSAVL